MGEEAKRVVDGELGSCARLLLGGAYFLLFVGTIVALASLNLGWRPAFIELWDGRARLVAKLTVALIAFVSLAGGIPLGAALSVPRAVRLMLGWAAGMCGAFLMMGVLELSPRSTLWEVFSTCWRWAGIGAALGLGIGLASLIGKPDAQPPVSARRRHLGLLAIMVIVTGAGAFDLGRQRPRDDGRSTAALRLTTANGWVEVGSYEAPLIGATSGYLRASAEGRMNSVALLSDEWPDLVDLIRQVQPSSSSVRRVVGSLSDEAPGDPTILTVSDGPDVRLILSSPKGPTITAVLTPAQAMLLRTAIDTLTDKLG